VKPVNPLLALAVAATAIALLYALLSPLGSTHEQAGEVYASSLVKGNFTRVKVVGRGIAYGEPEEFTVRVGVQVDDVDASKAFSRASEIARGILDSWISMGIDEKCIRTSRILLSPKYEYTGGRSRLTGFTAVVEYTLSLQSPEVAAKALSEAVSRGANLVSSLTIGFSKKRYDELYEVALNYAVLDAERKAEAIAKSLDMLVVGVESISVSEAVPPPYKLKAGEAIPASVTPPIMPGETAVEVYVTAVFLLAPKP